MVMNHDGLWVAVNGEVFQKLRVRSLLNGSQNQPHLEALFIQNRLLTGMRLQENKKQYENLYEIVVIWTIIEIAFSYKTNLGNMGILGTFTNLAIKGLRLPIGSTFFADLCMIMNSYILLRISYRVKDKEQTSSFIIFYLLFIID